MNLPILNHCPICGTREFTFQEVLWKELIAEWQLIDAEVNYINKQQGYRCVGCNSNLRSMVLAQAILKHFGHDGLFSDFVQSEQGASLKVLEINEAGNLHPFLKQLKGHFFAVYPEVDMMAMPFDDDVFDVVIHSDTLEHIINPVRALSECWRVLKKEGSLFFTIPVIVGRLTRSRAGLPKSFHGNPSTSSDDFVVQTEFGCDAWMWPIQAGFNNVNIHTLDFPSALAFTSIK